MRLFEDIRSLRFKLSVHVGNPSSRTQESFLIVTSLNSFLVLKFLINVAFCPCGKCSLVQYSKVDVDLAVLGIHDAVF